MLLLDEPTNHLDAESVNWLERHLTEYEGTIVAVTHDRYFLDNAAKWILELDYGQRHSVGKGTTLRGWIRSGGGWRSRRSRSRRGRGRWRASWSGCRRRPRRGKPRARPASRPTKRWRAEQYQDQPDELEIQIPPGPRLGDMVIEAENLGKSYGDRVVFENVNFRLPAGGIVGIIGPNGAGKTTLLRMFMGQEEPDTGSLKIGKTVDLGYVDQSRDDLKADKTVYEEISGGHDNLDMGGRKMNSRAYVSRFNFTGTDQQKKVGVLSGGERNRVHLAKLLRRGSNVLLLDEPTNDLDVDTLRALEEAVANFVGCAVVVSHDRWFLDRLATHILAFEGDGYVHWCEGNFQAYEHQRHERLGDERRRAEAVPV